MQNYRPISLLSIFYKIMASLIKERIDNGLRVPNEATWANGDFQRGITGWSPWAVQKRVDIDDGQNKWLQSVDDGLADANKTMSKRFLGHNHRQ